MSIPTITDRDRFTQALRGAISLTGARKRSLAKRAHIARTSLDKAINDGRVSFEVALKIVDGLAGFIDDEDESERRIVGDLRKIIMRDAPRVCDQCGRPCPPEDQPPVENAAASRGVGL